MHNFRKWLVLGGKINQNKRIENPGIYLGVRESPSDWNWAKSIMVGSVIRDSLQRQGKSCQLSMSISSRQKHPIPHLHREEEPAQLARRRLAKKNPILHIFIWIIKIFIAKMDFDGELSRWLLWFSTLFCMWTQSLIQRPLLWTLLKIYLLFPKSTQNRWSILKMLLRASLDVGLKLVEIFGDAWCSCPMGAWWEKMSWSHNTPIAMDTCLHLLNSDVFLFCTDIVLLEQLVHRTWKGTIFPGNVWKYAILQLLMEQEATHWDWRECYSLLKEHERICRETISSSSYFLMFLRIKNVKT